MKKSLFALTLALAAATSFAADSASVNIARVTNNDTGAASQAQTFRVNKDVNGLALGLQVRTQVAEQGGLANSVEATVGSTLATPVLPLAVYGGVGHDNGANGARGAAYQYGLIGAKTGVKFGSVDTYAGVQTRLNWESKAPSQNLGFVGASVALSKSVSANVSFSRSFQDIREDQFGLGLSLVF